MHTPGRSVSLFLTLILACAAAQATQEVLVTQKNKAFSQEKLTIHPGDKVTFRNEDSFVHNVFSLTDANSFDLGAYPQGQAKSVTFAKAGTYDIECAIHPEMKLQITVAP
jgi:plastocyanin